jgi:SAM-dependent methyltransferase
MLSYAPIHHWNTHFRRLAEAGRDLDWRDQWTGAFIEILQALNVKAVLDLGCGTGNDVQRMIQAGFQVVGLDYSSEALQQAARKGDASARFVQADMGRTLPFASSSFDALMSNVALHMFSDALTRALFKEIARLVRSGGVFVFHVNALEDRPLRAANLPVVREIEPNYVLEAHGQTMHFFSDDYLRDLLTDWAVLDLTLVPILKEGENQPYKVVWRGIAQK